MDLSKFPRRCYTPFATPIEPLPRFSAALAATCPGGQGPEVWIKRDDMLGLFPGGNKTRKLEFLAADALAQGADTLITCGAPQSNHCRITLAAAVKEGLHCRFVIEERVPGSYDEQASGNHFMFRLLGVEAITVVPGGSNMAAAMQAVADALSLLANIVMSWNTAQMQTVLDRWANRRQIVPPELIGRVAPTRLEGINLRGVFRFPVDRYAAQILPSQTARKTSASA